MNNKNQMPQNKPASPAPVPKKKKSSGLAGRIIRRFFLVLFTTVLLALVALVLVLNMIFHGPSIAAQEMLTMTLIEASATKWVPALFLGEERVAQIQDSISAPLQEDVSSASQIVINRDSNVTSGSNEWANYPDGIRFDEYRGKTYVAHIMVVKDPSRVSLGLAYEDGFSLNKLGKRASEYMEESDAVALVNGGAFNDDGTGASTNGSLPQGLTYADGKCQWENGTPPGNLKKAGGFGFAGFNKDDILVVAPGTPTKAQAEEWNIRDGVCFGPVLIMNGEPNMEAYNKKSGLNPRTAIGQRADGAVIFVCIDGRQPGSMGAEYADIIDIMTEYGAVNACNLDGGSSSVMLHRTPEGEIVAKNNYSLLQKNPRRMPNFWIVRPAE